MRPDAQVECDAIVVGGGLLGAAVSYGLSRQKLKVVVLDEGDVAFRAARGNFGLVWVQSKGANMPEYARWTRRSADLWDDLQDDLRDETGIAAEYRKTGGLQYCFSDAEMDERAALLNRMHNMFGPAEYGARMMDRSELETLDFGLALGPEVKGASYCEYDGHANPLKLLRAMIEAAVSRGAQYITDARVDKIDWNGSAFSVDAGGRRVVAPKIVLAAGLGNRALGEMVGLDVPVEPLKGQILVTEKTAPVLPMATHVIRQTDDGTVMIGDSHEDVGFDLSSSADVIGEIARRGIRTFPGLAELNLVRAWAALRVMTPGGTPLYLQSTACPGAYSINCHSGVTLAAAHALELAPMIARDELAVEVQAFGKPNLRSPEALHVSSR